MGKNTRSEWGFWSVFAWRALMGSKTSEIVYLLALHTLVNWRWNALSISNPKWKANPKHRIERTLWCVKNYRSVLSGSVSGALDLICLNHFQRIVYVLIHLKVEIFLHSTFSIWTDFFYSSFSFPSELKANLQINKPVWWLKAKKSTEYLGKKLYMPILWIWFGRTNREKIWNSPSSHMDMYGVKEIISRVWAEIQ